MISIALVFTVLALVFVVLHIANRLALWPAVLCLILVELLQLLPLR